MPLYRFIGTHTNGRTAITICGVTFTGTEPAQVEGEALARLRDHPEFEAVNPLDHDGDGQTGGSLPKRRRGRPRKAD